MVAECNVPADTWPIVWVTVVICVTVLVYNWRNFVGWKQ